MLLLPLLALLLLFRCYQQLSLMLLQVVLPLMLLLQTVHLRSRQTRRQGCLPAARGIQHQQMSTTRDSSNS
jgi:hypothetical protein